MIADQDGNCRLILDAADDFREAANKDDLWVRLHRHMIGFGITDLMYGSEALPDAERKHDVFLNSYDASYMDAKLSSGLYYCDVCVQAVKVETAPILWSDVSRLGLLSAQEKRSLDVDWDYGVTTGVTLPMRFHRGMGASGLGCRAAHMSWAEFDRVWSENKRAIRAIAYAFDVRLREAHSRELFPLAPRERECLLWLAAGQRPQQIAHRLGTHVKTVEKQIESARRKLNAATPAQAVATALVFDLLTP